LRDLRVVKGTAVYSGNFTPPTGPLTTTGGEYSSTTNVNTSITASHTSLLTCHLRYIADGSSSGHTITINGDVSVKPFTPYDNLEYVAADHGGSVYFDGGGDKLSLPFSADTNIVQNNDDFTIEAWVYPTSFTGAFQTIISQWGQGGTSSDGWILATNTSGQLGWYYGPDNTSTPIITGTSNPLFLNSWNHVAIVRTSGSHIMYVNGSQAGTYSGSPIYTGSFSKDTDIGYYGNGGSGSSTSWWNGYISDLRFVKGSAVYTSNFTPPTVPLTAITNTSLLVSGTDASIIDKSQSSNILLANTAVGSADQFKFANTKSLKFYGNSNYARAKDIPALRTGDFTYEGWIYTVSGQAGTANTFFDTRSVPTSSADGFYIMHRTDNYNKFRVGTAGTVFLNSTNSYDLDTWHHWALVRSGTTCTFYINGVADATTFTSSMDITSQDVTLGASMAGTGNTWVYLQDVRISSYARYTADFTPPTAPLKG